MLGDKGAQVECFGPNMGDEIEDAWAPETANEIDTEEKEGNWMYTLDPEKQIEKVLHQASGVGTSVEFLHGSTLMNKVFSGTAVNYEGRIFFDGTCEGYASFVFLHKDADNFFSLDMNFDGKLGIRLTRVINGSGKVLQTADAS